MAHAYHPGERAVQARAGETARADRVARSIRPDVPDVAAAFLAAQPFLVLGARDAGGAVWASLLTGPPGFARAPDPRTVAVAARPAPGDPLAGPLGAGEHPVGLLAIEPATRRRMRINGTATPTDGGLSVRTDEVFANCPKYIQVREEAADGAAGATAAGTDPVVVAGDRLTDAQAARLASADTLFIATAHPGGAADASHRGGSPGFVVVHDERRLSLPDYTGNAMYMTLGNLLADPHVGLLLVDWERGGTLQLTGTATVDFDPDRAAGWPGALRVVDVTVDRVVAVEGRGGPRLRLVEASRLNPPAPAPA